MNYDEDKADRDISDKSSPANSNNDNNSLIKMNYSNYGYTHDGDYINSDF